MTSPTIERGPVATAASFLDAADFVAAAFVAPAFAVPALAASAFAGAGFAGAVVVVAVAPPAGGAGADPLVVPDCAKTAGVIDRTNAASMAAV